MTKMFQHDLFGGGDPIELTNDKFTVCFEHIATTYPVEIDLNENEFKLMTTKKGDMDYYFDQALLSLWIREQITHTYGRAFEDIADFQENHFLEGVYKNGNLRSH
jgi:hypothetical protein